MGTPDPAWSPIHEIGLCSRVNLWFQGNIAKLATISISNRAQSTKSWILPQACRTWLHFFLAYGESWRQRRNLFYSPIVHSTKKM